MANAPHDENRNVVIQGVDHVSFTTPTNPAVDTATHAWLVKLVNGFSGATKTRTSIASGLTMTAGAGNATSSTVNLSAGYGAQLSIQLTNGATGPTVAGQVQIQTANDSGGTLWVNFGGALVGSTTNSAVTSWSIDLPIGIAAVRLISGSNTAQNVTLDADIANVTAL